MTLDRSMCMVKPSVTIKWGSTTTLLCDLQVHDRMTEQMYNEPLTSFAVDTLPTPVYTVPVMEQGREALIHINEVRRCSHYGHIICCTFRSSSPVALRLGCCQSLCHSTTRIVAGPLCTNWGGPEVPAGHMPHYSISSTDMTVHTLFCVC